MITLRLFKTADPFQEVASRPLNSGAITLGRDASADWVIEDARGDISRRHCTIQVEGGAVRVRDHSTNGIHLGLEKRRLQREHDHDIHAGETLFLGEYMVIVDADVEAALPPEPQPAAAVEPASRSYPATDAGLLEAFCHGAGLEGASFIGEDPTGVMMRLGAIYRQVIDDLSLLLNDRAAVKDSLKLDRTTISARDNNPLKWAAPERVAVDLLKERDTGFLKGAEAFRASLEDLRRHNASVMAGSNAAIEFVLRELSPEAFEASQQRVQPLGFLARGDTPWKQYQARHRSLADPAAIADGGQITAAAREAYRAKLTTLAASEAV